MSCGHWEIVPEGTKGLTESPQSPALSPWECSGGPRNDCVVRDQSFITTSLHALPKDDKWDFLEAVEPGVRELCQLSDKAKPQLVAIRVRHGSAGASVQGSQLQGLGISPVAAPHSSLTAKSLPCPFKTQLTFSLQQLCQANISE